MKLPFTLRILLPLLALEACDTPEEAVRVDLPVVADSSAIAAVTTDLGYAVELTEARAAVENFTFAVGGEAHLASLQQQVSDFLLPKAYAHPGHFQGGDVTGELRGRFILDWLPQVGEALGTATLLTGSYESANFTFIRASLEEGIASDDPLLGHTAVLRGRATKGATSVDFVALIDSPEGRELTGAPFELEVKEDSREELGVRLATHDPTDGDTLFDGLDFGALDADGDGQLVLEEGSGDAAVLDAYNLLRRSFQTHDHFDVTTTPPQ